MPPQINEVLVLHHTHTDLGYTHPLPMLMELQRRFIDQAIDACQEAAELPEASRLRWTCECTFTLLDWLDHAKHAQVDRFRALADAGLIGAAALPFHPTPMLEYGQWARLLAQSVELRSTLGLPMKTAIAHDINGMPWPTVSHLRQAKIDLLIMGINIVFGAFPLSRPGAFRWRAPDGEKILVFNGEHYAAFNRELHTHADSTAEMAKGLHRYIENRLPADYPFDFLYLTATHPFFVDNNPPEPNLAKMIARWNAEGRTPIIRTILPETLLSRVQAASGKLETYSGDWPDAWNFGAGSSTTELRIARQTKRRLRKAEALIALNGPANPKVAETLRTARTFLDLWDEHTWGAHASVAMPFRDSVYEQWVHKATLIWQARSLTSLLIRDQLEYASGNPPLGAGCDAVLALNPTAAPIHARLRLPKKWFAGTMDDPSIRSEEGRASGSLKAIWQHFSSNILRIEGDREMWDDVNAFIAEAELPPACFTILPADAIKPAAPAPGFEQTQDTLAGPSSTLGFDPATGRITSWVDRATDRELLDHASPFALFDLVHECPESFDPAALHRGREAMFNFDWGPLHANRSGWRTDWKPRHTRPEANPQISIVHDALGITLVRHWPGRSGPPLPGVASLTQKIRLRADRPVIECITELDKLNIVTPESIYCYVPLNLAPWAAHYDIQGLPVQYGREQLPGVITDYLTVDRYLCMSDPNQAVTLACPDAPLVQPGGFRFGRCSTADTSQPGHVALWPINNYWMTNFRGSQPGVISFRYELSCQKAFSPNQSTSMAEAADEATEIEVHPMLSRKTALADRLIHVEPSSVRLLGIEPGSDELSLLIRLVNTADHRVTAGLDIHQQNFTSAHRVDLCNKKVLESLKTNEHQTWVEMAARSHCTIRITRAPLWKA